MQAAKFKSSKRLKSKFTWYQTSLEDIHVLGGDLIDKDFEELWNEIRGSRRRQRRR